MTASVVFFGSGPVAAKSLKKLYAHTPVEAVITKPSPTHHKDPAPMLEMCTELGLAVHTPVNKKELDQLFRDNSFDSKLGLVIDYGIIISKEVIDAFALGIINSHFSLLPRWRGADPITFAILSGDTKTGVSLMVIDEHMDTGKLITQKTLHLASDETTPSLTDKLISLSDELLQDYLPRYVSGAIKPRKQPHPDRTTYSRKLTKDDGILDFTKPAKVLEREIRAFVGWPASRTNIAGKDVIITGAHALPSAGQNAKPGDINVVYETHQIGITTSDGTLWIDRLKPAGKNEMTAQAFLAGHKHLL